MLATDTNSDIIWMYERQWKIGFTNRATEHEDKASKKWLIVGLNHNTIISRRSKELGVASKEVSALAPVDHRLVVDLKIFVSSNLNIMLHSTTLASS